LYDDSIPKMEVETMSNTISYELLRRLAEDALDQGDTERAAAILRPLEEAPASALADAHKRRQIRADEMALVMLADRARPGRLAPIVDMATVQAKPGRVLVGAEEGIVL